VHLARLVFSVSRILVESRQVPAQSKVAVVGGRELVPISVASTIIIESRAAAGILRRWETRDIVIELQVRQILQAFRIRPLSAVRKAVRLILEVDGPAAPRQGRVMRLVVDALIDAASRLGVTRTCPCCQVSLPEVIVIHVVLVLTYSPMRAMGFRFVGTMNVTRADLRVLISIVRVFHPFPLHVVAASLATVLLDVTTSTAVLSRFPIERERIVSAHVAVDRGTFVVSTRRFVDRTANRQQTAGLHEAFHVPADLVGLLGEDAAVIRQFAMSGASGRHRSRTGSRGWQIAMIEIPWIVLIGISTARQGLVRFLQVRQPPRQ